MSLDKILKKTGKGINWAKQKLEPRLSKVMTFAALNGIATYEVLKKIDQSELSDPTNALLTLGAGGAIVVADHYIFFSPKTKKFRKFVGGINKKIDKNTVATWLKTGILTAGLIYAGSGLKPYVSHIKEDIVSHLKPSKQVVEVQKETKEQPVKTQSLRARPEFYDTLGYEAKVNHDFTGTKLAPKDSDIGRVQRTLRWQPIYNTIEKAYGHKKDTLGGMIIQESFGDPVQPNAGGDGGFGVVHIQGTTAKMMGMKIHGDSTKDSDKEHGKEIQQIIEDCNYDHTCIEKYDERANILKVLDAGARIVEEGHEKYGTWEHSVEYYRAPGKVGRTLTWKYMKKVEHWMDLLQDKELIAMAAIEFEKTNGTPFRDYIRKFHEMSDNWGLSTYVQHMPGVKKAAKSMADQIPTIEEARTILAQGNSQSKNPIVQSSDDEWVYHTAKKGDTVYGITHRVADNKLNMDQFRKQNKIHEDKIVPGQKYKLYRR